MFATAAISIADFVPSVKELYIRGFKPTRCSGFAPYRSQMSSGVPLRNAGRYFVPLPAATTSNPSPQAHSTSSWMSAGWSPYAAE